MAVKRRCIIRYIALDIETTGLDPNKCQILEIAAIIEDTKEDVPVEELPTFHKFIENTSLYFEPAALKMNLALVSSILNLNASDQNLIQVFNLTATFANWLVENKVRGRILFAGKNIASFDLQFLKLQCLMWEKYISYYYRTLDPAILYTDPANHTVPPSLYDCAKLAGITVGNEHRAVDDARLIISLLRHKWNW